MAGHWSWARIAVQCQLPYLTSRPCASHMRQAAVPIPPLQHHKRYDPFNNKWEHFKTWSQSIPYFVSPNNTTLWISHSWLGLGFQIGPLTMKSPQFFEMALGSVVSGAPPGAKAIGVIGYDIFRRWHAPLRALQLPPYVISLLPYTIGSSSPYCLAYAYVT